MANIQRIAIALLFLSALAACEGIPPGAYEPQASPSEAGGETVDSPNQDASNDVGILDGSEKELQEPDLQFAANPDDGDNSTEIDIEQDSMEDAPNNPQISDEQEFEAVSSRETIESDAERLKRLRGRYTQVESEAVPERPGSVNIAEYALSTSNELGERLYRQVQFGTSKSLRKNCAPYGTADDAQYAFLLQGGPEKDPLGIDPDGDGFACNWSPLPFRSLFK